MIVVTTNEIPGYRITAVVGEVMGMTVRSANVGANFTAGFRALGGGEVPEYTQLVFESRQQVMARMVDDAVRRGGNAIVGMRFDSESIAQSFSEICAYGTAVVVEPIAEGEPGATPQGAMMARGGRPSVAPTPPPAPGLPPAPPAPPAAPAAPPA